MRDQAWIDGIDYWAGPQLPKRRCEMCPTLLRSTNPDSICELCKRKAEAADKKNHAAKLRRGFV